MVVIEPRQVADALMSAERDRKPIRPFTDAYPFLGTDRAYQAQQLFVDGRLKAGDRVIGAKLGMTSRVKRNMLGVDQPVSGWLTGGMILAPDQRVPLDELIHPLAEPEIAIVLGREPDYPATVTGVLSATEAVFAAIEVIDSRFEDFRYRRPDVIADNVGAARFALGPRACPVADLEDLRLTGCVFRAGGEVIGTAAGGEAMGHPAAAVAWLVNTLAARGQHLPAGTVVLTGGLTTPAALGPGSVLTAEFDQLGAVEIYA
ncbi:MAG: 2-keto-4-pentenoate hydratase [Streptosporangiaceae bacterium]